MEFISLWNRFDIQKPPLDAEFLCCSSENTYIGIRNNLSIIIRPGNKLEGYIIFDPDETIIIDDQLIEYWLLIPKTPYQSNS
jgi:hypothetical protein